MNLEPLRKIYLAKLLSRVRWFDMLTAPKLSLLAQLMEVETFPANRSIFEEGDVADRMYIVVSGRVSIFKRKNGGAPSPGAKEVQPDEETVNAVNASNPARSQPPTSALLPRLSVTLGHPIPCLPLPTAEHCASSLYSTLSAL